MFFKGRFTEQEAPRNTCSCCYRTRSEHYKGQRPCFLVSEKMTLDGGDSTVKPLVNGSQDVVPTGEKSGTEAGEEGEKNDKEIVLIQDTGFNVQIQIPGGSPIELPVRLITLTL
jgi:hypothetical protein